MPVKLSWTEPDRGSPITSYNIFKRIGPGEVDPISDFLITIPSLPRSFEDFDVIAETLRSPGYQYTITANNEFGEGPESSNSILITFAFAQDVYEEPWDPLFPVTPVLIYFEEWNIADLTPNLIYLETWGESLPITPNLLYFEGWEFGDLTPNQIYFEGWNIGLLLPSFVYLEDWEVGIFAGTNLVYAEAWEFVETSLTPNEIYIEAWESIPTSLTPNEVYTEVWEEEGSTVGVNLISWWDFEETSGTRFDSVVASGNDFTNLTGGNFPLSTLTAKTGTRAVDFTLTTQVLYVPEPASDFTIDPGDSFTFAGWIRITNFPSQAILLEKGRYKVFNVFNSVRIESGSATTFIQLTNTSFSGMFLNTWYFITAWFDNPNNIVGIGINNVEDTLAFTGDFGVFGTGTQEFSMGARRIQTPTRPIDVSTVFSGKLDAWGFWRRALTTPEKADIYNSGNGLQFSELP